MQVAAEWALWGRQGRGPSTVLAHSEGTFTAPEFTQIIDRMISGMPEDLPQVTVGGVDHRSGPHLVMAVQEEEGQGARTRLFCVPYDRAAKLPLSFEELYLAVHGMKLPREGPALLELSAPDLTEISDRIADQAVGAAALLLGEQSVCIRDERGLSLVERLRRLDDVSWLLPYGIRTSLSASTGVSSTAVHGMRLFFARQAVAQSFSVSWDAPVEIPTASTLVTEYVKCLGRSTDRAEKVGRLAAATSPLGFTHVELITIPDLLSDEPLRPETKVATPDEVRSLEQIVDECGQAVRDRRLDMLVHHMYRLRHFADLMLDEKQQKRLRNSFREWRLLWQDQIHEDLSHYLYTMLLPLAYGPELTLEGIERILKDADGIHPPLLRALVNMPSAGAEVSVLLARQLGEDNIPQALGRMPADELVGMMAGSEHGTWIFAAGLAEFGRRDEDERPAIAAALRAHDLLVPVVERLFPNQQGAQFETFSALLTAAYGESLTESEFTDVTGDGGNTALFAAASALSRTRLSERPEYSFLQQFLNSQASRPDS